MSSTWRPWRPCCIGECQTMRTPGYRWSYGRVPGGSRRSPKCAGTGCPDQPLGPLFCSILHSWLHRGVTGRVVGGWVPRVVGWVGGPGVGYTDDWPGTIIWPGPIIHWATPGPPMDTFGSSTGLPWASPRTPLGSSTGHPWASDGHPLGPSTGVPRDRSRWSLLRTFQAFS